MSKANKQQVPKVRFTGVSEDWKNSKLKDLAIPVAGNDGRQNIPILTISAAHGFLDQKARFSQVIAGNELKKYTLLRKGELSYNRGNSKLAKFGVVYSLMNYEEALVPNIYHSFKVNKDSNSFFIESVFESKLPDRELGKLVSSTARMDGMLNINSSDFMGIAINHPTVEEQTQIGNFFQQLDKLIDLQSRAVESAETYKKAMLQKMFPLKGEKVPGVRFEGFSEELSIKKANKIFKTISEKNHEYLPVLSATQDKGIVFRDDVGIDIQYDKESLRNYKKISKHQFVIHLRSFQGGLAFSEIVGISSPAYTVIDFIEKKSFAPFYWKHLFTSQNFINRLESITYGVRDGRSISFSDFSTLVFAFPSLQEQTKIGNFFQKLDQNIESEKKKLEQYKTMKRALLQRMFV